MKLRLYHYWRSSSSWRVRWALALKNIPYEAVAVDLVSGESESDTHRARNPMGYVPVLEFLEPEPGAKKIRYLAESLAIIEWLDELKPQPRLLPQSPLLRARTRQLAEIINAGTQPIQNLSVTEMYSNDPQKKLEWNQHWIKNGLAAYEEWVRETAGKFSVGDTVTLADLCLIPQCYNAGRNEVSLDAYPTIQRINAEALKTEACIASFPKP